MMRRKINTLFFAVFTGVPFVLLAIYNNAEGMKISLFALILILGGYFVAMYVWFKKYLRAPIEALVCPNCNTRLVDTPKNDVAAASDKCSKCGADLSEYLEKEFMKS